jgi:hypothetical protein
VVQLLVAAFRAHGWDDAMRLLKLNPGLLDEDTGAAVGRQVAASSVAAETRGDDGVADEETDFNGWMAVELFSVEVLIDDRA